MYWNRLLSTQTESSCGIWVWWCLISVKVSKLSRMPWSSFGEWPLLYSSLSLAKTWEASNFFALPWETAVEASLSSKACWSVKFWGKLTSGQGNLLSSGVSTGNLLSSDAAAFLLLSYVLKSFCMGIVGTASLMFSWVFLIGILTPTLCSEFLRLRVWRVDSWAWISSPPKSKCMLLAFFACLLLPDVQVESKASLDEMILWTLSLRGPNELSLLMWASCNRLKNDFSSFKWNLAPICAFVPHLTLIVL